MNVSIEEKLQLMMNIARDLPENDKDFNSYSAKKEKDVLIQLINETKAGIDYILAIEKRVFRLESVLLEKKDAI